MRDLKILFINDIDKKLSYRIHELVKLENGYYKLEHDFKITKDNYKEYQENTYNKYCYVITHENRILEKIYPDKIMVLKGVVDNLYEIKKVDNSRKHIKKLTKK